MKVRVVMTIDVDYQAWAKGRREFAPDREISPAACRSNIQGLAEDGLVNELQDYVPYSWVEG